VTVDLKKEQLATLDRPRYPYSAITRFFVKDMDVVAGKEMTLAKAKVIEMLAGVPYRSWQSRESTRMTEHYRDPQLVESSREIVDWSRQAEDREYRHLRIIEEKMREDGARDPWYLSAPSPQFMVRSYGVLTWSLAQLDIRRGFVLNAEFEDHAEHTYAELVRDHPEWEEQPVASDLVKEYGDFETWADVFRRVGLDERDHMNHSFTFAERPDQVVHYEGMPEND
jgi:ubiquinol oxidase